MITLHHRANRQLCPSGLPFPPQPFLCFLYCIVSNMGPTFSLIREWVVPFSLFETKAENYSNLCEATLVRDKGTLLAQRSQVGWRRSATSQICDYSVFPKEKH